MVVLVEPDRASNRTETPPESTCSVPVISTGPFQNVRPTSWKLKEWPLSAVNSHVVFSV